MPGVHENGVEQAASLAEVGQEGVPGDDVFLLRDAQELR